MTYKNACKDRVLFKCDARTVPTAAKIKPLPVVNSIPGLFSYDEELRVLCSFLSG